MKKENGIILKALSGFYYVDDGITVTACRGRGRLRHQKITPLVGDRKYGDGRVNRYVKEHYGLNNQFLFAYRLVWHSGEGVLGYLKDRCWTAPWPEQLEGMIGDYFGTNGLLREAKES